MRLLPKWVLTGTYPAFYDSESATAIEQTAKVYGAMNELIEEHNKFTDTVNASITKFMEDTTADNEVFRVELRQEFQDFIDIVNLKMLSYEDTLSKLEKTLLSETERMVNNAIEEGKIKVMSTYDEATEALTISMGGGI